MQNSNPHPSASNWGPERFARLVREWIGQYGILLDALIAVRELGDEKAAEALLTVDEVRQLRLSWELWEALREGEDPNRDPLDELRPHLSGDLDWFRDALWGTSDHPAFRLRAVPSA